MKATRRRRRRTDGKQRKEFFRTLAEAREAKGRRLTPSPPTATVASS
jgi:hypothetical protein